MHFNNCQHIPSSNFSKTLLLGIARGILDILIISIGFKQEAKHLDQPQPYNYIGDQTPTSSRTMNYYA